MMGKNLQGSLLFLWKAKLRSLNCRGCEQTSSLCIHPLSYPSSWTNIFAHPWEYLVLFKPSQSPPCLPQLHKPHPAEHLFILEIKVVSSLFVTANGRISLSLCCIFPCIQTLEHYNVSLVNFLLHWSLLQPHVDEVNSCHWRISPAKFPQNYMWK